MKPGRPKPMPISTCGKGRPDMRVAVRTDLGGHSSGTTSDSSSENGPGRVRVCCSWSGVCAASFCVEAKVPEWFHLHSGNPPHSGGLCTPGLSQCRRQTHICPQVQQ